MNRKDNFKNECQAEMTAADLDCPKLYHPKWRGKAKRKLRKLARKRLRVNDAKTILKN